MSVFLNNTRIMRSARASTAASAALTSAQAYFTYLGFLRFPWTPQWVSFHMQAAGSGALTRAELGLFSTPLPPNKSGQSLTKIVATGAIDSLTAAGPLIRRNSGAFATTIPGGTHLWAGLLEQLATTQPTVGGFVLDLQEGWVLTTAAAASFTTAGPWVGAIPAIVGAGTIVGLDLSAELD